LPFKRHRFPAEVIRHAVWKGAKLTLQAEAGCSQITMADKSVRKPDTPYVTCRNGGVPHNVFFTRSEAEGFANR